jgi:NADPH2:quinone reductase
MDEVLLRLNIGARVVLSGMISQYESSDGGNAWAGQRSIGQLIMRRASMSGFLVLDHPERFPEAIDYLAGLLAEGQLHSDESVIEGLDGALDAVNSLFDGGNTGKLLVRLGDAELPVPVTA